MRVPCLNDSLEIKSARIQSADLPERDLLPGRDLKLAIRSRP
jgi:hypothetical protein